MSILKMVRGMEGQPKRCLRSILVSGSACAPYMFLSPRLGSSYLLKCFALSLAMVVVISRLKFNFGNESFLRGFVQNFCFATALVSKTVVEKGTGSNIMDSLAKESASSLLCISTWAAIHWRLQDYTIASMQRRRELISLVSLVFFSEWPREQNPNLKTRLCSRNEQYLFMRGIYLNLSCLQWVHT